VVNRFFISVLAGLTLVGGCRSTPAPPGSGITISRDFWPVVCRYGELNAKPLTLAFDLSPRSEDAERELVEALESAGFAVELFVIGVYRTVPRTEWPAATSPAVRQYAHPGTAVALVMGRDEQGRRHAFGGVHVLCKSDPSAPDSIIALAQSLDAQAVREAFARRGFAPYVRSDRQ
jgi:hypothetical protein